ncbi:MAG: alpha/beta hydrolase [Sphingomonadales bacterium]|nr:MAG: alpha/beta hydrolase [Sphingomonadales bacterium]
MTYDATVTMLMRAMMALAIFAGLVGPTAMLAAAPAVDGAEARGRFVFTGWAGPPLPVWYQLPDKVDADTPVVVVMHGVNRDADRYRDEWAGLAQTYRFIVIVPEFSARDFPGALGYNTGYFASADGTARPRSQWSFAAIEPLFDDVRRRFGTQAERYTLYGHSAGAQFVHRFVLFMPEARIMQAIAANAGWYTMPDRAIGFPYGLGAAPVGPDALAAALGKPLTVLLGTADTDMTDPNLRTTPEANRQGPHRLARGQSFYAEARAAAERIDMPFGWRMEFVPGVGHSNGRMARAAARLISAGAVTATAP